MECNKKFGYKLKFTAFCDYFWGRNNVGFTVRCDVYIEYHMIHIFRMNLIEYAIDLVIFLFSCFNSSNSVLNTLKHKWR